MFLIGAVSTAALALWAPPHLYMIKKLAEAFSAQPRG